MIKKDMGFKAISIITFLACACVLVSCGRVNPEVRKECIKSGIKKISYVRQAIEVFGQGEHNINKYGKPMDSHEWVTEIAFLPRYQLQLSVKVKISNDFRKVIEVAGEPKFTLIEYSKIHDPPGIHGDVGQTYEFGQKEWNEMYQNKSYIQKLNLKNGPTLKNFEAFIRDYGPVGSRLNPFPK